MTPCWSGVAAAVVLTLVAMCVSGCGGDGDRDGAAVRTERSGRAPEAFDVAAGEIPASATALFVRGDDAHLDRVEQSLRAIAGGRMILNALPDRTGLAKLALTRAGFAEPLATTLAPLVRDDVVVARSGAGWKLWTVLDGEDRTFGEQIAQKYPGQASFDDEVLRIANSPAAWSVAPPDPDTVLSRVGRWTAVAASAAGRDASVIGVDHGRVAAVRADRSGYALAGRVASTATCRAADGSADGAALLSGLSDDTSLAVADTTASSSGVGSLRDLLEHSATTVRALGAIALDGRLDRVRDALVDGATALIRLRLPQSLDPTVAVRDAGGRSPKVVPAAAATERSLADDPGFAATRGAAGTPRTDRAWWIDLDQIIRTAAADRLTGFELGVVQGLGSGVDGVLAWQGCDGTFGARIAITGQN
jgi:hypothetical protein